MGDNDKGALNSEKDGEIKESAKKPTVWREEEPAIVKKPTVWKEEEPQKTPAKSAAFKEESLAPTPANPPQKVDVIVKEEAPAKSAVLKEESPAPTPAKATVWREEAPKTEEPVKAAPKDNLFKEDISIDLFKEESRKQEERENAPQRIYVDVEEELPEISKKRSALVYIFLFLLFALVMVVISKDYIISLKEAKEVSNEYFIAYASISGALIALAFFFILRNIMSVLDFKKKDVFKERTAQLHKRNDFKRMADHLTNAPFITEEQRERLKIAFADTRESISMLTNFESIVLLEKDRKANAVIRRYCLLGAVELSASPKPWMDILFTLFNFSRMLKLIADIYGIKLSLYSFAKLFILGLTGTAAAGAAGVAVTKIGGRLAGRLTEGIPILGGAIKVAAEAAMAGMIMFLLGTRIKKALRPIEKLEDYLSECSVDDYKKLVFGEVESAG
jgi:uncharacterized membrane protein YcjF (UPF0283 family)